MSSNSSGSATQREAWQQLLRRMGAAPDVAATLFVRLQTHYNSPSRAYHNLAHIDHVLEVITMLAGECAEPNTVRLAAWLHDIVYVPGAPDNEHRSATLARRWLSSAGVSLATGDEVGRLILLTAKHETTPADSSGAVLIDADLAILGASPPRYDAYARAIRLEYAYVPDTAYRTGRVALLRHFLARTAIYRTALMHTLHESQARRNLARELAALVT